LTFLFLLSYVLLSTQCPITFQSPVVEMTAPPNVVLWSWDALQRNHCLELLNRGELPNLKALVQEGAFLNLTIVDHRTDTKAGHAQMLTGYRWHRTGVFSNEMFFTPIPSGYTLLERVEGYFGKEGVATGMITGKKGNLEVDPVIEGKFCRQGIFSNVPEDVDVTSVTGDNSSLVGPRMIDFLDRYGGSFFVAFFHFHEPDHEGHGYGENSSQYEEGAKGDDLWLGRVVQKLKDMKVYAKTLIYITADHGFDEGKTSHSNAPFVWLATNDRRLKTNEKESWCDLVDVAPTIYYALGIDTSKFAPPLDGYPLQLPLPVGVAESRRRAFNDVTLPKVSVASPVERAVITHGQRVIINFTAADDNLIVVLLLINNSLTEMYERQVKGNWIQSEVVHFSRLYSWETTNLKEGTYIIAIIAFDEGPNSLPPETQNTKGIAQKKVTVVVKRREGVLGGLGISLVVGVSLFTMIAVAAYMISKRR